MSDENRIEELLIGEFRDAVKNLRDETRQLEEQIVAIKSDLKVANAVKNTERKVILGIVAGVSAAAGFAVKMWENIK